MSGLGELGELPGFTPGYGGQVSQRDIDQYDLICVDSPSVSASYLAAGTTTGTTPVALVLTSQLVDWPRNLLYNYTGGTVGGTFVVNLIDQFGSAITETVALGSQTSNGSVYGTAIAMKFLSGTFSGNTSIAGTMTLGFGTLANGSAASNWFGLLTRIGGTADVKNITWITTNTATALNKGTALGTLVNTGNHAFQGTSGVAITDHYRVVLKATYDNNGKGTMSAL